MFSEGVCAAKGVFGSHTEYCRNARRVELHRFAHFVDRVMFAMFARALELSAHLRVLGVHTFGNGTRIDEWRASTSSSRLCENI